MLVVLYAVFTSSLFKEMSFDVSRIEMGHRLHLLHISSIPFARDCYT